MTQQQNNPYAESPYKLPAAPAAPADVAHHESLAMINRELNAPIWHVGETYWCRNHACRVVIVSTMLRGSHPVAGIMLAAPWRDDDEVYKWTADGILNPARGEGVLDLTTELAP